MGNDSLELILDVIRRSMTLQIVNLSNNAIKCKVCFQIYRMLKNNSTLKELYLRWNCIKGDGGKWVFRGLKENTTLKVVDLSYNAIGDHEECLTEIEEFF